MHQPLFKAPPPGETDVAGRLCALAAVLVMTQEPARSADWSTILGDLDPATTWLPGALVLATFASEDLACVAAGLLVSTGALGLVPAILACAAGILVGDFALYGLGRGAAAGLVRWRWARARMPAQGGRLARLFDRRGLQILFVSRFLPGSRVPAFVAAGALRWPFAKFAAVMAVAALIWTPLLVWTSVQVGGVVAEWLEDYGLYAWLVIPAVLVCVWLASHTVPRLFSWRGRRQLVGAWRRQVAWEYWPVWAVYTPVTLWLAVLAVRYRAFALFSACNPGIPHGGLVLESKGDILDQLPAPGADDAIAVARYARLRGDLPVAARLEIVGEWLARSDAGRVVLKPDEGERGAGVAIVRDRESARAWLEACPLDAMVQEYVAGPEFGIVWARSHEHPRGAVRSIARKVPPTVVGDGIRTLEQLILAHPRHVALASMHLQRHNERLDEIPAAGAEYALGELGTHARGAAFLDARSMGTDALEQALARFMERADGLDFGRFDVRVSDDDALRRGEQLRILEFNGVTGEPAHVYHPGYPLVRGLLDLCRHWTAACRRGAENRRSGARQPTSAIELLRLVGAMRRRPRFEAPAPSHAGAPARESAAPAGHSEAAVPPD